MESVRGETELAASPQRVWAALMDLPSWPAWASFHPSADEPIALGVPLVMRFHVGSVRVAGRARFIAVEPERSLWWRGGFGPLVRIEHGFDLTPTASGGTRLVHEERFGGWLGGVAIRAVGARKPGKYARVNEALGRYLADSAR